MHEIKDEPILGNQSLFNGAPEDAVCVIKTNDGNKYFFSENDSKAFGIYLCFAGQFEISMRRIIRTPVWTKGDQKAGKLPEVGCEVMVSPKTKATVTAVDSIQKVVAVQCDDESLDILQPCEILPIETEAERQQRERQEWCKKASFIIPSVTCGLISDLGFIHDALVSGELKMPGVQK